MAEDTRVRVPQQARSKQRFDKILNAMAHLLEETDYVSINVALIAERAETSVGSLYQFFSNKDAVLHALTERYVEDFSESIPMMLTPEITALSSDDQMDRIIDWMIAFKESHPGFHHVMENEWVSPDVRSAILSMKRQLRGAIAKLVHLNAPNLTSETCEAAAYMMMGMVSAMMNYAASTDDEALKLRLAGEMKRAGQAYLRALIAYSG